MEILTALVPYAAYAAVAAAMVVLVNRVFYAGDSAVDTLSQIQLDPPWPHGVQEEEPVRWNIERLRRPARADASAPAIPVPAGVCGAQSAS